MTLREEWGVKRASLTQEERIDELASLVADLIGIDGEDELMDMAMNEDWDEIGPAFVAAGYWDEEDLTG